MRWIQSTRLALRTLARRPAFTLMATLTLALGIGANTAIFGVVRTVLLRPLPFPEPDELVRVFESRPGAPTMSVAPANYQDWRAESQAFEHLASFRWMSRNLVGNDRPERLSVVTTSGNFFQALGVSPALGRTYDAQGDRGARSVVLSDGLWRTRFGSDPSVLDRTIDLDGEPYQVLGVMPPGFAYPDTDADVWVRAPNDVTELSGFPGDPAALRDAWFLAVVGRLAEGTTLEVAQAELDAVATGLQDAYPDSNEDATVRVVPLHEQTVQGARTLLWVLFGAVGLVLAAACASVANLVLVRLDERKKELAVRSALGARRGRVVETVAVEALLVAALGGVVGVVFSVTGLDAVRDAVAPFLPRAQELAVDWTVVGYALLVTAAAAILFGAIPAWFASGSAPADLLNDRSSGGATGGRARRVRATLVTAQVAMATVLVLGTGLLLRSVVALNTFDIGYEPNGLMTAMVSLPEAVDRPLEERLAFYNTILDRASALPGVSAVGAGTVAPNSGGVGAGLRMPDRELEDDTGTRWQVVTPGYLDAIGTPLVQGRGFTATDTDDNERVALVNEAFARHFFAGEDPVGRLVNTGLDGRDEDGNWYWVRIVGVVGDIRSQGPAQDPPRTMYRPLAQSSSFRGEAMMIALRRDGEGSTLVPALREAATDAHPDAPVYAAATGAELASRFTAPSSLIVQLLAAFAVLALSLGAVGVYGVTALLVRRRRHEIGVRMALGARARGVVWHMTRQGIAPALVGLGVGLALALLGGRILRDFLFEVEPTDPVTFGAVAAVLAVVALIATAVPARRAARVDPVEAMRAD
jgi:putative ABC transport system permease protein